MSCTPDLANTLTIVEGTDTGFNITFKDANGIAIDITGYTVYFTVKNNNDYSNDDSEAVIQKDITSHSDPTSGITFVGIDKADSENLPIGDYKYNFALKDGSDKIKATQKGIFRICENVTDRT